MVFYIEQSENEVLDLIKDRLNLGPKIVFRQNRRKTFKDTYSLSISSRKDITSIINYFNNPLLTPLHGQKKIQFEHWKNYYHSNIISVPL